MVQCCYEEQQLYWAVLNNAVPLFQYIPYVHVTTSTTDSCLTFSPSWCTTPSGAGLWRLFFNYYELRLTLKPLTVSFFDSSVQLQDSFRSRVSMPIRSTQKHQLFWASMVMAIEHKQRVFYTKGCRVQISMSRQVSQVTIPCSKWDRSLIPWSGTFRKPTTPPVSCPSTSRWLVSVYPVPPKRRLA